MDKWLKTSDKATCSEIRSGGVSSDSLGTCFGEEYGEVSSTSLMLSIGNVYASESSGQKSCKWWSHWRQKKHICLSPKL